MWSLIKSYFANQKCNKAFTMLETAVVITVLGIILASVLMPYNLWKKKQEIKITAQNVSIATNAITNFLIQHGRYPCPASLTATRGDANYGLEGVCDGSDPNYPPVNTAGSFDGDYYYEKSHRASVDIDPRPGTPVLTSPVIIRRGALPFRTLGLAEDQSEDGYGMRLNYVVTENLTVTGTFVKESGGISLKDGSGNSLLATPNSAHYLVFSSGRDKAGAYSRDGILVRKCILGRKDTENCNSFIDTSTPPQPFADYLYAVYSESGGPNHYDDFLKFYSSVETPLWRVVGNTALHISDLIGANSGGKIGIGVASPSTTLEVAGEMRASNGNSMVDNACDGNNTDCIDVGKFGSETGHPDYECSNSTEYAFGISGAKAGGGIDCKSLEITCPAGDKMLGVNPDGSLRCSGFTGCYPESKTLCGNLSVPLPKTNDGDWANLSAMGGSADGWTPVAGISYQERWRCQSGYWQRKATSGICTCTPGSSISTVPCNSRRDGNWTGNITLKTEILCPSGNSNVTEESNNCVCAPTTVNGIQNCPPGPWSGGPNNTKNEWICDSSTSGHWGGVTIIPPDKCVCTPQTEFKDYGCPTGYKKNPTGRVYKRTYNCATRTWNETFYNDKCVCDSSTPPKEWKENCPPPLSGQRTMRRNWRCSPPGYGPAYVYDDTNCGIASYKYVPKSPGTPASGSLPISAYSTCNIPGKKVSCSDLNVNGGYWHYNICVCE